mgnify:CR=1 FL=1|jgi:hypothetical protein
MRVLGIDPSLTNYGWALHDSDAVGAHRCLARGRFQTSAKTLFIDRYIAMRDALRAHIEQIGVDYGVTRVGLEYPVFNDLYSEGMYGLFLYTCEALRLAQVDVVFFSPMQIKAHARESLQRPKGWKMMKPDMVEAAKTDCGGKGRWNHNEADGYWAAWTAARFWKLHDGVIGVDDLNPVERKQFTQIHTFTRGKKAGDTVFKGILHREDERFFRWSQEGLQDGD